MAGPRLNARSRRKHGTPRKRFVRLIDVNQLVYAGNHMEVMMGVTGDRIFVNGRPDHVEQVAATAYRVRLLNGSNSRLYKLAWSDDRLRNYQVQQ